MALMTDRTLRTYRLMDLGCKVNQYETQLIAEKLEAAGLLPAAEGQAADLCLVNTCAVTGTAAAKSARAGRQLRKRNPGALLVMAGCAVSAAGKEGILARTGADMALAQAEKLDLPGLPLIIPEQEIDGISRFDSHQRAFIKIQDGCQAFCSYCIVPHLRGTSRSRPLEGVRREAAALQRSGHRELVISGVHLGAYGRDLEDAPDLVRAVKVVLEAAPECRLRLSSLDPAELSDELLELIAAETRICPHLHLPLQSGDNEVLARMRRSYRAEQYLEVVQRARSKLSNPGITTDVMVGFPGENEAAFLNTVEVSRRAQFSRMHVFPFSPREGTPAAGMSEQVPSAAAKQRAGHLSAVAAELASSFAASLIGSEEEVLAEEKLPEDGIGGYSSRYVRVRFTGAHVEIGKLYRVRLDRAAGTELTGSLPR